MIEHESNEYESNEHERDGTGDAIDRETNDPHAAADETASAWFDNDLAARDPFSPAAATHGVHTHRRLADLQFLHVLLSELHHSSAAKNAARVESAMAAIRRADFGSFVASTAAAAPFEPVTLAQDDRAAPSLAPDVSQQQDPLVSRRSWLISSAAAAAGLSGVAAWLWSAGSSRSAQAAVQRIADDARIPRDRQYRVTQELNHARGEKGRIESLLYVRGGEKFAHKHRGAVGDVWMGSNGRQGWLVPVLGQPIITDNPRYPAKWARDEGVALPDLKLSGLLDLMAERFQLSMLSNEPLPNRPERLCQRISGWCDAKDGGPERIELWAHLTTGVAERLVLQWERSPDEAGLTRIELDLLSETPQPDALYEVDSHRHGRVILPKIPMFPSFGPS